MWRILLLTVFSLLLYAKEVPITQKIGFTIPYREFFIIEFPFEIQDIKIAPFEYIVEKNDTFDIKTPAINPKKGKKNKKDQPLIISRGKKHIQIYTKKIGKTELTVWGYKYPLMIKLQITKDKEANKYIKLLDYDKDLEENREFSKSYHEKICTRLIYYLYNNKEIKGYKTLSPYQEYKKNGLEFILIKVLQGRKYSAKEFRVKNISNKKILLNEIMFSTDGVYAVSIENRELNPNEATRLFVVTSTKGFKDEVEH